MARLEELTDNGERVLHLYPGDCYQAHLSIYHFARTYSQGAAVLDAGSGTGYGAAFFAEQGARSVLGVDISSKAVAFSSACFTLPNLTYQVKDLSQPVDISPQSFDLIFSSNVLEHVPDVQAFLRTAHTLLQAQGTMIIAVPPITDASSREANIVNPYHLNIWTPKQWDYLLSHYFATVQPYRHFLDNPNVVLDFSSSPEESTVQASDFSFAPVALKEINAASTMTAIFVVTGPRPASELPPSGAPVDFIDDSFTRPLIVPTEPSGSSPQWQRVFHVAWHTLRRSGIKQLVRRTHASWKRRQEYRQYLPK